MANHNALKVGWSLVHTALNHWGRRGDRISFYDCGSMGALGRWCLQKAILSSICAAKINKDTNTNTKNSKYCVNYIQQCWFWLGLSHSLCLLSGGQWTVDSVQMPISSANCQVDSGQFLVVYTAQCVVVTVYTTQ